MYWLLSVFGNITTAKLIQIINEENTSIFVNEILVLLS
jgi:hypothetical protein